MPTLIDLRRRIKSVKNTQQITKAMKTVSTAKYKKAQRSVVESRPLWHSAPALLGRMARWAGTRTHPLFADRPEKKVHLIVVTSDKGLCGAFNSNLLVRAVEFIRERESSSEIRLVLIGKKAVNFFRNGPYPVDWAFADKTDKLGSRDRNRLARHLAQRFALLETDGVYIAYNEFKSVLAPRITITKLLPIGPLPEAAETNAVPPDWEPAGFALLEALVPRYVEDQIAHALAESQAAEQAARMMAMDNASQNAEELISSLVLGLNKIRQAGITKELLEIMTAVEALKQ